MMCGFKATTKNKYRELQDHLVRRHFQDRIKAALPTRRPFMCPDPSCTVEGKDWQALMRHYTGKHGVLESYIKEFLNRQNEQKENLHLGAGRPISPLPPTNKIGCRRRRYKRHSSGDAGPPDPRSAEDGTEDPPATPVSPPHLQPLVSHPILLKEEQHTQYVPPDLLTEDSTVALGPPPLTPHEVTPPPTASTNQEEGNQTILQLDDSEPAEIPPTHLALVLKRRRVGCDGRETEPEETYAFVDLKYFQPLSANQYVMKSQVIEPSAMLSLNPAPVPGALLGEHPAGQSPLGLLHPSGLQFQHPSPSLVSSEAASGNSGENYFLESDGTASSPSMAVHGAGTVSSTVCTAGTDQFFQSFPMANSATISIGSPPPLTHVDFTGAQPLDVHSCVMATPMEGVATSHAMCPLPSYDQVVPNHHHTPSPPDCASEIEISTGPPVGLNEVVGGYYGSPVAVMEIPLAHLDPKGLTGRGCSKVVVETVKSIPMDGAVGVTATSGTESAAYELISSDGIKEIDFTMF